MARPLSPLSPPFSPSSSRKSCEAGAPWHTAQRAGCEAGASRCAEPRSGCEAGAPRHAAQRADCEADAPWHTAQRVGCEAGAPRCEAPRRSRDGEAATLEIIAILTNSARERCARPRPTIGGFCASPSPGRERFQSASFYAQCEWACAFSISLEELLRALEKDEDFTARCFHQGFSAGDRASLIRFIVERNSPAPGANPLAALHESLWRWANPPLDAEAIPQLLLDPAGIAVSRCRAYGVGALAHLMAVTAAETRVWFVSRRRCRCVTLVEGGEPTMAVATIEEGQNQRALSPECRTPDWAVRLAFQDGEAFGWKADEIHGLQAASRRWGFGPALGAQPLPLLSAAGRACLAAACQKPRPHEILSLIPNFW